MELAELATTSQSYTHLFPDRIAKETSSWLHDELQFQPSVSVSLVAANGYSSIQTVVDEAPSWSTSRSEFCQEDHTQTGVVNSAMRIIDR